MILKISKLLGHKSTDVDRFSETAAFRLSKKRFYLPLLIYKYIFPIINLITLLDREIYINGGETLLVVARKENVYTKKK
jgi:hypothetical protein